MTMYDEGEVDMDRETVRRQVLEALELEAPAHGVDVVDVEISGPAQRAVVCVRLDHADESLPTITLDEVSAQSGWVSDLLEELDPIDGPYVLEVSSPGLDRPLRRAHDFERFAGERVALTTTATEGRRRYTGTLLGIQDGLISIDCDGQTSRIALDEVRTCKIKPTYDDPAKPGKRQ
jgi:ribosome maturation factor RimP